MVKIIKKQHCHNCVSTALNAVKSVPRGSFLLPIQTATIVPSTNFDKKISKAQFNNRIRETRLFLSNTFGGYTSVTAKGGYVAKKGKLIVEDVAVVTCFAQNKNFASNKVKWFSWIKRMKSKWKQENIGIIIENDMAYI